MYLKNSCHIIENALTQTQLDYIISFGEKEKLKNAEVYDREQSDLDLKAAVTGEAKKDNFFELDEAKANEEARLKALKPKTEY